jgi:hypothetical protein
VSHVRKVERDIDERHETHVMSVSRRARRLAAAD